MQAQPGRDGQPGDDDQDAEADLERLAAEMTARGYQAAVRQPAGRLPYLDVCNPRASVMAERVYAQADWFFWPWAQRIAQCGQPAAAAAIVARVLRADSETAGTAGNDAQ